MSDVLHPLAQHNLPNFLPGPDGSDPLLIVTALVLIVLLLCGGNLYLRLHALPEHMAHNTNSLQIHAIAVLSLLALFTHNNLFWVLALFLAVVKLPDFATPLNSIARSLELTRAKEEPTERPQSPSESGS